MKLKPGDIFEIETQNGSAYFQFVLNHNIYGSLIRVFHDIGKKNNEELKTLVQKKSNFLAFFPLSSALRKKIVVFKTNSSIPPSEEAMPLFKAGVVNPDTNKVSVWWLWDGVKEWKYDGDKKEIKDYPIRGIWNDTLLKDRIVNKWTSLID